MSHTSVTQKLINKALEVRKNAYAPYSNFLVGSAVLCEDGSIFTGCNIENASYGLTVCAERNAIFNAVAAGNKKIKSIAVVAARADGNAPPEVGPPCGACRQVIFEFGPDIEVIMAHVTSDRVEVSSISDLLPRAFGPSSL